MINISVLGYGTVGSGVVEVLGTNRESIAIKAGQPIQVKYILDRRDFPGDPMEDKVVHEYDIIVNDPEVNIIVETMGGLHPAYEFVKQALENGKSVCTSNKELVAKYGAELLALARQNKINFLFEASVGGGIPIIRPLNQSLTADEIEEITGILNGTTNYILTKMATEGADFETVLKDAQEKGYAERNPEADVEGYDACRKIAILSSLAYGRQVDYEDIYTEGITKITKADMEYAKVVDASIKIVGSSKKVEDKVYAFVAPMMIDKEHPLYNVNDVFNGIFVKGNVLGDTMFYGKGAGKLPTASAVVADVIDAAKHVGTNIMTIWNDQKLELASFDEAQHRFFVRVAAEETEKAKEMFSNIEVVDAGIENEFAFLTELVSEKEFKEKSECFEHMLNKIRVAF